MWFERFVIIVTIAAPRLPAVELGVLHADASVDISHVRRHLRPVLHAVPAVHPLPADDRDRRGQGRDAAGGSAPRRPRHGAPTTEAHDDDGAEREEAHDDSGRRPVVTPRPRSGDRSGSSPTSTRPASSTTRARSCATPATSTSTRTRRSRCTASRRRWACQPSKLPWIVLAGGTTGLLSGDRCWPWCTSTFDYPLNISGKPPFSYQAYIPIIFELTVLFSAFACVLRHVGPATGCRRSSTRPCSTRVRRGPPTTRSSSRSRRRTRSTTRRRRRRCSRSSARSEDRGGARREARRARIRCCSRWPLGAAAAAARARSRRVHLVPDMDWQPKCQCRSRGEPALRRRPRDAPARRRARCARPPARGRRVLPRQGSTKGEFVASRRRSRSTRSSLAAARSASTSTARPATTRRAAATASCVQRGYPPPVELTSERVRDHARRRRSSTPSRNGVRNMPAYASRSRSRTAGRSSPGCACSAASQHAADRRRARGRSAARSSRKVARNEQRHATAGRATDGTAQADDARRCRERRRHAPKVGLGARRRRRRRLGGAGDAIDAQRFAFSYLIGFMFVATIALGALFFVLIQHLTQGRLVGRGAAAHGVAAPGLLPASRSCFIPIVLLGARHLAPLDGAARRRHDRSSRRRPAYLNPTFFYVRAVVYLVIWALLAAWFCARARDAGQDRRLASSPTKHAGGCARRRWSLFALTHHASPASTG